MGRRHSFELVTHDAADAPVEAVYEVRLMPVWDQHQVLRRTMPLVAARVGAAMAGGGHVVSAQAVAQMVASLADLKEEDHDYVLDKLLGCVSRRLKGADPSPWAPIWLASHHKFNFDDMNYDLQPLYQIVQEVVQFTYGNFTQLIMSYLPQGAPEEPTSTQP